MKGGIFMKEKGFDCIRANSLFLRGMSKEAFEEYFKGAVEYHDRWAAFNLAFMYYMGIGVPKNYPMARKFWTAASNIEGGEAQFNLALMCLRGQGEPADYRAAAEYMRVAAARGCVNAQLYLGVAYTLGYMFDPMDIECLSLIPFYRVIKRDMNLNYLTGSGYDQRLEDERYEVLSADEIDAVEMFEAAAKHKDTMYIDEQVGVAKETVGRSLIEGFGKDYDPREGYRMLETAALEHNSRAAAIFLVAHKDEARFYGVDPKKIEHLLETNES